MNYCMLYLKTANVNLVKDMGMIPYKLYKLFGFNSEVATYKLGEYPYLNNEVKGLKIHFIKKTFRSYCIDGAAFLIKQSKHIDVLQIFHVTLSSVIYANVYKFFNKKGKLYLKLDCSHKLIERIKTLNSVGRFFLDSFLDKVDIISVEQECLVCELKELLGRNEVKLIHIANGVDYNYFMNENLNYDFNIKEKVILNVARIGAEEKDTPLLLEAFASIDSDSRRGWILKLVGPIKEGFESYIVKYFERYPELIGQVIFTGEITDRVKLYEEYRRATIFALTSQFESVGISFIEAAAFGDIIISTNVGIIGEIVTESNGIIVNSREPKEFGSALKSLLSSNDLQLKSQRTYNICAEKYNWDEIISKLKGYLIP